MTLKRRILFYTFTALFFSVGAFLLFIAQGYRYSPSKGTVELTGEIVVDSQPRGAKVILDGETPFSLLDRLSGKKEVSTPARIRSLLSGVYRLKIKKDGYYDWSQTVSVFPGKAVIHGKIQLLPRPRDSERVETPVLLEALPLKGTRILGRTAQHTLGIIDSRTGEWQKIFSSPQEIRSLHISPLEKSVLLHGISHAWIVPLDAVSAPVKIPLAALRKFAVSSRDEIFALRDTGIARYSFRSDTFTDIIPGQFIDFSVREQLLTLDTGGLLRRYDITAQGARVREIWRGGADRIAFFDGTVLALGNSLRGELLVFADGSLSREPRRIPHADDLLPLDRSRFVAWDDFEVNLFVLDEEEGTLRLVTRQSSPVRGVYAHKQSPYVFLLNENGSVRAQEISGDSSNNYQIFGPDAQVSTLFEREGVLYFAGSFQGKPGIIPLPIP